MDENIQSGGVVPREGICSLLNKNKILIFILLMGIVFLALAGLVASYSVYKAFSLLQQSIYTNLEVTGQAAERFIRGMFSGDIDKIYNEELADAARAEVPLDRFRQKWEKEPIFKSIVPETVSVASTNIKNANATIRLMVYGKNAQGASFDLSFTVYLVNEKGIWKVFDFDLSPTASP